MFPNVIAHCGAAFTILDNYIDRHPLGPTVFLACLCADTTPGGNRQTSDKDRDSENIHGMNAGQKYVSLNKHNLLLLFEFVFILLRLNFAGIPICSFTFWLYCTRGTLGSATHTMPSKICRQAWQIVDNYPPNHVYDSHSSYDYRWWVQRGQIGCWPSSIETLGAWREQIVVESALRLVVWERKDWWSTFMCIHTPTL